MTLNPKKPIRVLIVDDHPSIRRGLKYMISVADDIECVGEGDNGEKAVELAQALSPDVIIMDLAMPNTDGVQATQAIRAHNPGVQVLVLTSFIDLVKVQSALQAGAIGYLLKTADDDAVIAAIRDAAAGRAVLAREATEALIASTQQPKPASITLTEREHEVLRLMAKGMSNQEIAKQLFLALPTVKFHITNILSKLRVDNRTEAVLMAIKLKWVIPEDGDS